eukprot:gnl/MRDRNA2_/MRDRNA2_505578_c0_seq1.p1 gnl/MRDRNA2_/MRDRNA2_505578_c0~~gnl/MRDRNA2_/MRDRNA2_505578_c0_seq1.p1  ORF type:complete len:127 (-),score=26.27 gnl/MRDRNA2_/MRDRNA2_505578_c0_seq1:200-580(-)
MMTTGMVSTSCMTYGDDKRMTASAEQLKELSTWLDTTIEGAELGLKELGDTREVSPSPREVPVTPEESKVPRNRRATMDMGDIELIKMYQAYGLSNLGSAGCGLTMPSSVHSTSIAKSGAARRASV